MQFELKAWKYITISRETMDVTILDSCNVTRFNHREGISMAKESREIDNVSLKCFIVSRC